MLYNFVSSSLHQNKLERLSLGFLQDGRIFGKAWALNIDTTKNLWTNTLAYYASAWVAKKFFNIVTKRL
jgi:hypothetical protein